MHAARLTSSALVGRDVSSGFFVSLGLRLSRLAGRGLSSTSFEAERLAVGVLVRVARELEAMLAAGCAPTGGWPTEDDDVRARTSRDVLGRAWPAGGVDGSRASMACKKGRLHGSQLEIGRGTAGQVLTWDCSPHKRADGAGSRRA